MINTINQYTGVTEIIETFKYRIFTITKTRKFKNVYTYEIVKTDGGFLFPANDYKDVVNFENDIDLFHYINRVYFGM